MNIDWGHLFTSFEGRISRTTYWIGVIVFLVLQALSYALFGGGLVGVIVRLALTFAIVAIMVKRAHDWGKTGWLAAIAFIPFIGGIWTIVLGLLPPERGANAYGSDPRGLGNPAPAGSAPLHRDTATPIERTAPEAQPMPRDEAGPR